MKQKTMPSIAEIDIISKTEQTVSGKNQFFFNIKLNFQKQNMHQKNNIFLKIYN